LIFLCIINSKYSFSSGILKIKFTEREKKAREQAYQLVMIRGYQVSKTIQKFKLK